MFYHLFKLPEGIKLVYTLIKPSPDLHGPTGSMVGHSSVAPGFKPWLGYVRRLFNLSLWFITFGGCSAHLAYLVHRSTVKQQFLHFWLPAINSSLCSHLHNSKSHSYISGLAYFFHGCYFGNKPQVVQNPNLDLPFFNLTSINIFFMLYILICTLKKLE